MAIIAEYCTGVMPALSVAEILYQEFREPHYAPPPLLKRLVTAGWLGKKSGKGFYDYTRTPPEPSEL